MALHKARHAVTRSMTPMFLFDRRDRRPGTHFAADLGPQPGRIRREAKTSPDRDPQVDEDLGCCAFGIDLLFLPRG